MSRHDEALERKKKAAQFVNSLTINCIKCGVPGSKQRLIKIDQGPTCSGCLHKFNLTLGEALQQEKANKAVQEHNPDIPKPENYGEWA